MPVVAPSLRCKPRHLSSFTLVELLVVILIILLLAGLTLAAGEAAMNAAARGRARGEIQALTSGLENYKTDNGTYPWTNSYNGTTFGSTNDFTQDPSASGGDYVVSAQILYESLSGQTNFEDTPVSGVKNYMTFKTSQLGNVKATAGTYTATGSTYVQDPFSYPYGFYTDSTLTAPVNTSYPYNGHGMFDLWSTAGTTPSTAPTWTNSWLSNWKP